MAIRVIKHGAQFLRATCPHCGCLFKFEIEDMFVFDTGIDKFEEIKCPECNYTITWWYGEKSGRT